MFKVNSTYKNTKSLLHKKFKKKIENLKFQPIKTNAPGSRVRFIYVQPLFFYQKSNIFFNDHLQSPREK